MVARIHSLNRLGSVLALTVVVANAAPGETRPAGSSWLDAISSPDSQEVILKNTLKTLLWLPHPASGFSAGVQASASRSFGVGGAQLGLGASFYPIHWLGIRMTAGYENTPYLFVGSYRVNGLLLGADLNLRWRRLSAALGTNLDYYIAPIEERSIFGWHAEAGLIAFRSPDAELVLAIGHLNRVNPRTYGWAMGGSGLVKPWQVLLDDSPGAYVRLDIGLKRWRH